MDSNLTVRRTGVPQAGPKQAASQDAFQHCPPGRCDEDAAPRTVPRRQDALAEGGGGEFRQIPTA